MRKNWLAKQMIGGNCGSLLLLATEALINKSCQRGDFTHASGTTKVKRNKKNGCAIWMAFEMKWWYFQPAYGWMVWPGQPCWSHPLHWICQKMIVFGPSKSKFQNMTFFIWSNKKGQIKDVICLSLLYSKFQNVFVWPFLFGQIKTSQELRMLSRSLSVY